MRLPWPFSLLRKSPPNSPASRRSGDWGENVAADFLRSRGYRILGRNVRFGPRRELDAVARSPDSKTLVFVEVKTRKNESFGRPVAAVDSAKRRALARSAAEYLRRLKRKPPFVRFDVVEVVGSPGDPAPVVRHIENAFDPGPHFRVPW